MTEQEWLQRRKSGLGASDAASVMGCNPWKSNLQLWKEKAGLALPEDIGDKPVVQYGKAAEKQLRELFALDFPQYKVTYDEFGMIANRPNEPWLFATLDGELETNNGKRGVLEIKTTEIMHSRQWSEWKDGVPQHYYCQMLHQLLATGYDFCILKAQIRHRDTRINAVEGLKVTTKHYFLLKADVSEDMDLLLKREQIFWQSVKDKKQPAQLLPEI